MARLLVHTPISGDTFAVKADIDALHHVDAFKQAVPRHGTLVCAE